MTPIQLANAAIEMHNRISRVHDQYIDVLDVNGFARGEAALVSYVSLRVLLSVFEDFLATNPEQTTGIESLIAAIADHKRNQRPQVQA